MLRRINVGMVLVAMAMLVGCTRKIVEQGVTTLTFQSWIGVAFILGGMFLAILGFFVRKKRGAVGWVIVFIGAISTFATGPAMFADRLTTDDKKFILRTGLWLAPTIYEFEYQSVKSVIITKEKFSRRSGYRFKYFANVTTTSNPIKIPFDDTLMSYGGWEILMNNLALHDISIIDEAGR